MTTTESSESRAVTVPAYDLRDRFKLAQSFAESGFFGCRSPHEAMSLIMLGEAEGKHPAAAMMEYHIIEGRPTRKAMKMAEMFVASGGRIVWEELTDKVARAAFSHPKGSDITIEWTIEQARAAGLVKDDKPKQAWKTHPRAMLRSRVWSEGCVTCYPAYAVVTLSYEEALDMMSDAPTTPPPSPPEEDDGEGPGNWAPRPTNLDGTGFMKGAQKRDAVSLMTAALERAAAQGGAEAVEAQWAADAHNRRRLSDNAQYGLEEVKDQHLHRLKNPPPEAGAGLDGPAADSPPSTPETKTEEARIDEVIEAMYAHDDEPALVKWATETMTVKHLDTFTEAGRERLRGEYATKLLSLREIAKHKALAPSGPGA